MSELIYSGPKISAKNNVLKSRLHVKFVTLGIHFSSVEDRTLIHTVPSSLPGLPQQSTVNGQHKTTKIYCLTAPEAESPKPRCQQGPLKHLGKNPSLLLPSLR